MKAILIKLTVICSFLFVFVACNSDGEVRHLGVTAVKMFYEPLENEVITLETSASATLYFEWEPARAEDSGGVQYEIAFDKVDGDFSDPLFRTASDNNGGESYATILHSQLTAIATKAGIATGQQGAIKWTVYSVKGINPVKAELERTLIVIPPVYIPDQLYITGDATEAGADLSNGLAMKKVGDGEFEIYTQLTAGKTFKFVTELSDDAFEYSVSGAAITEGGTSSVSETGVYNYSLNFKEGTFSSKQVTKVSLYLNWSQLTIELPYKGLGVWELTNYTITGLTDNDNTDDRYKFRMESSAGETEWRAIDNDDKPTGDESYYYMVEKANVEQWTNGEVWKSPAEDGWSDKTYDFMFSLSTTSPYTHNLVIK